MSKDLEGYNNPTEDNFNSAGTPSRADCEGTIVNSPYNKPRVKYDRAEEVEAISFESSDSREYVDLDTHKAKMIMTRARRFNR